MSLSAVENVQFTLASDDHNVRQSVMFINSYELFNNEKPTDGGLFDARMGTTDFGFKCRTCENDKKNCMCHFGVMHMKTGMQNPLAIDETKHWLKIVCNDCGALLPPSSKINKLGVGRKLSKLAAGSAYEGTKCPVCNHIQMRIFKDDMDYVTFRYMPHKNKAGMTLTLRELKGEKLESLPILYPFMIKKIFDRVTDDTVIRIGECVEAHPRNFILNEIPVPPVSIRPSIRVMSFSSGPIMHDITNAYQSLFRQNNQLPDVISEPISPNVSTIIVNMQMIYHMLIKGSTTAETSNKRHAHIGSGAGTSILRTLAGKEGLIRGNILGKRAWEMARATIAGNPRIRLDEIGKPKAFARKLQIEEIVQNYNIQYLMTFFLNGRDKYPGCTRIKKKADGITYSIDSIRSNFRLEIGDAMYRDLVTGDITFFNRQPSLERSATGVHKIVVFEGESINTIQFNVSSCPWYNSDFYVN